MTAGAASLASAAPPAAPGNGSFLALGDSLAFAYIAQDGYAYVNPNNFIGYAEYVGEDLRLDTANAACPGETTSGFLSSTGSDYFCRPFRAAYPLHVAYPSTQLAFATDFLATHKQARLVTIGLGANDILLLQSVCGGDVACIQAGLPAVLTTIALNMTSILNSVHATGFGGVLMVVNYYSLDYTDVLETSIVTLLNQTLAAVAAANGAVVADAFSAFQTAASTPFAAGKTCKTGLLNGNPQDQSLCDDHPSQSGHRLLADTIEAAYRAALAGR
jgi:lysophospholipase L1-like esterase